MNRQQAMLTTFTTCLLVMVGLVVWMLFGMADAKRQWLTEADAITADLDDQFTETIVVDRTSTPDGLVETVTIDGIERPDCKSDLTGFGWTLVCAEDVTLTPESDLAPIEPLIPTSPEVVS